MDTLRLTKFRLSNKTILSLLIGLFIILMPSVSVVADEWGGYVSEKLIDMIGVSDSNLLIQNSGVTQSEIDIVMNPTVSTLTASGLIDGKANLNGQINSLNGFPSANVYFEWGYDTSYGNTTTSQSKSTTGEFSDSILFDSSKTVHYRAVVEADSYTYGSDVSFEGTVSFGVTKLLKPLMSSIIALVVMFLIFKIMFEQDSDIMSLVLDLLVTGIGGVITYYAVVYILNMVIG